MKFTPRILPSGRREGSGFTLVEMMVAVVLAIIVVGGIAILTAFTAQNYLAVSNYVQMDNQSRTALDKISREIRDASALVGFVQNQSLWLTNDVNHTWSKINYDSANGTLTLTKEELGKPKSDTTTLLTECDTFAFSLYDRYPTPDLSFHPSTNYVTGKVDAQFCKVINLNWKCSRKILGSKLNTEIVQTAQVVLRNQVYK